MKLKSTFKCLTITAVLSQITVYPITSYAENIDRTISTDKSKEEQNSQGLLGYHFKDNQFEKLSYIEVGIKNKEEEKKQRMKRTIEDEKNLSIQSVRWLGRLVAPETGEYTLSTSFDQHVILQINGETLLNKGKTVKSVSLEKDKAYEVRIEYQNKENIESDLQLFWSINGQDKKLIPHQNIVSPDFSEKENLPEDKLNTALIPNSNLFNGKASSTNMEDTDQDGIPDEWEEKGYTFKNQQIVKWDDSYLSQGYKKYLSNPYKARTIADPYTDFEKVSGHMPAATKEDARDPLVAAYPAVGVGMENLLFSKNENVTEGSSGTMSKSVTDTNTNTNNVDLSAKLGWNDKGFGFEFTPKYSHTWTNSTAVQNSESESWSSQVGINSAESAYLNANVRYYNAGTAPIYDLKPTTNFVLQNSGKSLATITAGPNQIGNSLGPGDTYPKVGQAPISLDKANDAGTVKIPINKDYLNALQSNSEALNLETTQNKGQYGVLDATGQLITDSSKQWDPVRTNIDSVSGSLTLNLGSSKESLERRVAAKNDDDPEDKTPEITIGEAIKKAFNAKEKDGRLYYVNSNGENVFLDESSINLIGDENTKKDIEQQLEHMEDKKVYNAKWKRDMKITIHVPTSYYDFEKSGDSQWHNTYQDNGGYTGEKTGRINPRSNGYAIKDFTLKPYTSYTARAYVKASSSETDAVFYVDSDINSIGKGINQNIKATGDKWKLVEMSFNTGSNPELFKKVGFKNQGNVQLQFDDVSVTEWKTEENLEKTHSMENWDVDPSKKYVKGGTFSHVPNSKIRYQWKINDNWEKIIPAPPVDNYGKRVMEKNFNFNDHVELYAVDEHNDYLKVKVAEHNKGDAITEDVLKSSHQFSTWIKSKAPGGGSYTDGWYFERIPDGVLNCVTKYKVSINGGKPATRDRYNPDKNGRMEVNLLEYNGGRGVKEGSRIEAWAILSNGKEAKVLDKKTS
ncbi:binary toxin-like calcium binding domain-containing protein [Bacillus cereus]|uniref:binary toxin-like calcium binding domain-containing protein n=1 Tax=Bacillus cereus TaxID=1396 RepID=UPI003CEC63F2